ncbi:hypothetical protein CD33_13180 [Ureibacillus sinduriensis BLB-1 = JCM 15800]|uniref:CobW C-terminal domain-containing protein n=2 Tax=Ureibacillus sinduriensis TaxID=561440 RepID=A0A0A3HXW7_9BACL|nr:hypothetical protein CD33_13180 [Ureibacillus sinduriensis BLB-1 = JCM 15800]
MKNVEVVILSGFLGSGKTTLLQNLLDQEKKHDRKYAVVMNEIGNVSIDSDILSDGTRIEEIVNGCICCTNKSQLEKAILTLTLMEQPDVIYIESSGIAHPMEIYDTCLSPVIAENIFVKSIMTVLDGPLWLNQKRLSLKIRKLLEEQVRYADQILINKMDLLNNLEYEKLLTEVNGLNPLAVKKMTTYSKISLEDIAHREEKVTVAHEQLHVENHLHVSSLTYLFEEPINRGAFMEWLNEIPSSIYRIKGFLRFDNEPDYTYLFQYAYGVPYFIESEINFSMNLVMIGENLNKETCIKQLNGLRHSAKKI